MNVKQWRQRGLKRDMQTAAAANAGFAWLEMRERVDCCGKW